MGPFPHDAPAATISADNPMGTDGFEFVEYAHPKPEELHALFKLMGYAPVARHKTKKITVYRQGDINYLVNEEPGTHGHGFVAAHGPCAPSMAFRVVDAKQAYERALSLGAEPADVSSAQKTLDVPAIKGIGGSVLYFVDRYGAKGSAYDTRVRMAGRERPAARGRRALLYRSPHPQRPSRPHGCVDRLLRKAVQLPPDPLLRHRGPRFRPVLARADQPGRQDPDSDQRGRRRFRADRGISQHLSRRGHPAHRLRRAGHLRTVETLRADGLPFMPSPPDTYFEKIDARLPQHGEDVARLQRDGILIDGEGVVDGGHTKVLLQIFSANAIGPIFFEFIQRKGDDGFGEGNFKALFESIEEDQIRRGVLKVGNAA